jgi:hypothetical protein
MCYSFRSNARGYQLVLMFVRPTKLSTYQMIVIVTWKHPQL